MGAFDVAFDAGNGSPLEPHERFFEMGEGDGVFPAAEWTGLEAFESVDENGQEGFLGDAIDAEFFDGAILEQDGGVLGRASMSCNEWI